MVYDVWYHNHRTMSEEPRLVGEERCWRCTIANTAVAALVAGVPLLATLLEGEPVLIASAVLWVGAVAVFTGYHLVTRGYLPGSDRIAKRTGLHERIGPGSAAESEEDRESS